MLFVSNLGIAVAFSSLPSTYLVGYSATCWHPLFSHPIFSLKVVHASLIHMAQTLTVWEVGLLRTYHHVESNFFYISKSYCLLYIPSKWVVSYSLSRPNAKLTYKCDVLISQTRLWRPSDGCNLKDIRYITRVLVDTLETCDELTVTFKARAKMLDGTEN